MLCGIVANLTWYFSFIQITPLYSLLINASGPVIFFKGIWTFFTNALATSITPLVLTPNVFAINVWSMVIFSPLIIFRICPSFVDFQVHKNPSNRFNYGIIQWTTNKPFITLLNLFLSLTPHHVFGTRFGRYYIRYVRRTSFYFQKPSFNWLWWKCCQSLNFNSLLSSFCFLCGFYPQLVLL